MAQKYAHILDERVHWVTELSPDNFEPGFLVPVNEGIQEGDMWRSDMTQKYAHILNDRVHWVTELSPDNFEPGFLVPVPEGTQEGDIELSPGVYGASESEPLTP